MTDLKNIPSDDAAAVIEAAGLLDLREFDFFRLAYFRWFARHGPSDEIEKHFAAYMFHETVPPWVRHCCREVIRQHRTNTLDGTAFGAADFRPRNRGPKVSRMFLMVTAVLMVIVYISLLTTRPGFDDSNCPGRYAGRYFEQWIYMINGQQPPPCDPAGAPPEENRLP